MLNNEQEKLCKVQFSQNRRYWNFRIYLLYLTFYYCTTDVQSSDNRQARLPVWPASALCSSKTATLEWKEESSHLNSHQTTFASWAFRNAAPVVWNSLPHQLTDDQAYPASFRHNLKTHLFSKSFCHWLPRPVRNGDSSIYFGLTHVASPTA